MPPAPGSHRSRLLDESVERDVRRETLVEPLERACGREHHAHRLPCARHGVAERMHPAGRVVLVRGQRREHDARRPEDDGEDARPVGADADRRGGLVACAGRDREAV